jgi:hypothetical protein
MEAILENLQDIISGFTPLLEGIDEKIFILRPSPGKWSKKEILGHLIDSAQNNIRRFIVAQYNDLPEIIYNQDEWVRMAGYQDYPLQELIQLWILLNKQLYRILSLLSADAAKRKCLTNSTEAHSLEWLAADYNRHLLHHLHQILDMDPVYYS